MIPQPMDPLDTLRTWLASLNWEAIWAVVVGLLTPIAVGLIPLMLARASLRRERRALITVIHRDLTTNEVANARNVIGAALQDGRDRILDRSAVIHGYYVLLWAVERADHALRAANMKWEFDDSAQPEARETEPKAFSTEALGWNIEEILEAIITIDVDCAATLGLNNARSKAWFEGRTSKELRRRYWEIKSGHK